MRILDQKGLCNRDRFQWALFLSGAYTWKSNLTVSASTEKQMDLLGHVISDKLSINAWMHINLLFWHGKSHCNRNFSDLWMGMCHQAAVRARKRLEPTRLLATLKAWCSAISSTQRAAPSSASGCVGFNGLTACIHTALCVWWDP